MMNVLRDTVHVNIDYGSEEHLSRTFKASCEELLVAAHAPTLDELLEAIRQSIKSHLRDSRLCTLYNITPDPRIVLRFQWSEHVDA